MSMRNKLAEAMAKGVELERDRCMAICIGVILSVEKGLDKKLMTTTEKHTATVKLNMARAFIGAVQMKIMSGEHPHAKTTPSKGPGFDPDALGDPQGDGDDGRPA